MNRETMDNDEIGASLNQKLNRLEEMLQGHDAKATNAFVELEKDSEEVVKKLYAIKKEAVKSEEKFADLSNSIAEISTVNELKLQTRNWAFHMNDAGHRIGYEIDAIQSILGKMRTFVSEKNAMIGYLLQSVEDIRYLYGHLEVKPMMNTTETQTDALESMVDYENLRSTLSTSPDDSHVLNDSAEGFRPLISIDNNIDTIDEIFEDCNESFEVTILILNEK